MIVWTNKYLHGDSMSWKASGGKSLELYNNTGRVGKRFDNIYLSYRRDGRKYIVALNRSNKRKTLDKTVGIWVSDSDYTVSSTGEMFTGKTSFDNKIIGRFGIYNVGTIIVWKDVFWVLKADRGWVIKASIGDKINWLDNDQIRSILEMYGFAVYNSEDTSDLREALRQNVIDGTIPIEELEDL